MPKPIPSLLGFHRDLGTKDIFFKRQHIHQPSGNARLYLHHKCGLKSKTPLQGYSPARQKAGTRHEENTPGIQHLAYDRPEKPQNTMLVILLFLSQPFILE